MLIKVEDIREHIAFKHELNSKDLKEIEFTYNGQPVRIPEELYEWWDYTGLTNMWFIEDAEIKSDETGYYFYIHYSHRKKVN